MRNFTERGRMTIYGINLKKKEMDVIEWKIKGQDRDNK